MVDGRQRYETKEIPLFAGLITSIKANSPDFPDMNSSFLKNFLNADGALESRKGRRRLNYTTYNTPITSLIPYIDRNGNSHLIFSVQSAEEANRDADGTLKDEVNFASGHTITKKWLVGNSYCYDIKVAGDYVYVMLFNESTGDVSSVKKYTKSGSLDSTMTISTAGYKNCFEIDDLGNIYLYREVSGGDDVIEKFAWSGTSATATYTIGATAQPVYAMQIYGGYLYASIHTGTNAQVRKFTLSLTLDSTTHDVVTASYINSIAFSRTGTPFITLRNAAGTTRSLYSYVGAAWVQCAGEFINLPDRVVSVGDNLYLSLVDDTVTGASEAMFYIYDSNMAYQERLGNAYLSAATKNKPWDIATIAAYQTANISIGSLIFDVDADSIYFLDVVTDAGSSKGLISVVKKFRR